MSCLKCKHSQSLDISTFLIVPYSIENKETTKVLRYFQYEAPGISSAHSVDRDHTLCKSTFGKILHDEKVEYSFCGQSAKISKHLTSLGLSGNYLCFKCNRFVCKLLNPRDGVKEEQYQGFLRHMRNSIAHGNIYCKMMANQVYFIFDDYSLDGKHNLTARILIKRSSLMRLMKAIKAVKE